MLLSQKEHPNIQEVDIHFPIYPTTSLTGSALFVGSQEVVTYLGTFADPVAGLPCGALVVVC